MAGQLWLPTMGKWLPGLSKDAHNACPQTCCAGQASQQDKLPACSITPLRDGTDQAGTPPVCTPSSRRAHFEHDVGEVVEVSGLNGNPCVGSTPGSQGGCDLAGCIPCYHAAPAVAAAVSLRESLASWSATAPCGKSWQRSLSASSFIQLHHPQSLKEMVVKHQKGGGRRRGYSQGS